MAGPSCDLPLTPGSSDRQQRVRWPVVIGAEHRVFVKKTPHEAAYGPQARSCGPLLKSAQNLTPLVTQSPVRRGTHQRVLRIKSAIMSL